MSELGNYLDSQNSHPCAHLYPLITMHIHILWLPVLFPGRFCVCLSYFEPIFEKNYQLFQKKLPIFQKKLPIFQKNLPSFQKIYQVFKKFTKFSKSYQLFQYFYQCFQSRIKVESYTFTFERIRIVQLFCIYWWFNYTI